MKKKDEGSIDVVTDYPSRTTPGETVRLRKKLTPKYIVDPEWMESSEGEEYLRIQKLRVSEACGEFRDAVEDYYPEDYDKRLPEEGAWIRLLTTIRVGKATGARNENNVELINVPHLSMWFALPTEATAKGYYGVYPSQAAIQTPQGEVRVWPREYVIVRDISLWLDATEEEGVYIKFMNESNAFDVEKLFYIMARGISRGEAQKILLPELRDPFFCYFELHQAYSDYFGEGCGMSGLNHANYRRRAEARARKSPDDLIAAQLHHDLLEQEASTD